ncbi:hypothetical protein [Streptomyces purpureus]|uniref:Uncharacterized protein n=1 Tax=Streptomyces purpureus TaxID=1951 RepID=A0A918GZR0_9ACTN|nr:hypothetical protein [Streptomyces purpureus]GGT27589.1 hypothetical protein GCM10014713_21150 [Streptomyces purpureus]
MPRPTAAQLAYGSATVVFSTVAMLLLFGTTTGVGVAVIGVAALLLGLLVAMTVPLPGRRKAADRSSEKDHSAASASRPQGSRIPSPRPRSAAGTDSRISEHSLRR